jgi:hypothetical protein
VSINGEPEKRKPRIPFKEGQEVILKCGGDVMVVDNPGPKFTTCVYQDGYGQPQFVTFRNTTIRKIRKTDVKQDTMEVK